MQNLHQEIGGAANSPQRASSRSDRGLPLLRTPWPVAGFRTNPRW